MIIRYGSSSDTWEGSPGRQNYELSILDTNKPHSSTCFMYLKLVEFKSLWTQSVEWGFCSDENQQNPSCSEDNHHHIRVHDSKFECWKPTKINRPRLNCSETIAVSTVSETSIGLVQYQLLFRSCSLVCNHDISRSALPRTRRRFQPKDPLCEECWYPISDRYTSSWREGRQQ